MTALGGWPRDRYTGRGGGLSKLPGGGLSTGPGGGLSTAPGGGLYTGPGGGLSTAPGGGLYTGPGGGLYADVCDKHYRSNQPPMHIFIEYLVLLGLTDIAELLRNTHGIKVQGSDPHSSNLHNKTA